MNTRDGKITIKWSEHDKCWDVRLGECVLWVQCDTMDDALAFVSKIHHALKLTKGGLL